MFHSDCRLTSEKSRSARLLTTTFQQREGARRNCWKSNFEAVFIDSAAPLRRVIQRRQRVASHIGRRLGGQTTGSGRSVLELVGQGFTNELRREGRTRETIRGFVAQCPPFQALLLAVCVPQYDLAIREEDGKKPSSHRNDLFMAVYLPYCDEFVSDDRGQQIRLREIVSRCKLTTRVRWYREFRDSFSINVVGRQE